MAKELPKQGPGSAKGAAVVLNAVNAGKGACGHRRLVDRRPRSGNRRGFFALAAVHPVVSEIRRAQ